MVEKVDFDCAGWLEVLFVGLTVKLLALCEVELHKESCK